MTLFKFLLTAWLNLLFPQFMASSALIGGILGGTSLIGGAMSSSAAKNAAKTQSNAALEAARIQAGSDKQALDFQKDVYNKNLQLMFPWLSTGTGALANLAHLAGVLPADARYFPMGAEQTLNLPPGVTLDPQGNVLDRPTSSGGPSRFLLDTEMPTPSFTGAGGPVSRSGTEGVLLSSLVNPELGEAGSLMKPFEWKGPEDPAFKFRLEEGRKLLEGSAAAKGNLLTGGTAKAIDEFGQNLAATEFQSAFDRDRAQKTDQFNRLSSIAGTGQMAAAETSRSSTSAADAIAAILSSSGARQGDRIQDAANARASGYVGGANAWSSALGRGSSDLTTLMLLSRMFPQGVGAN